MQGKREYLMSLAINLINTPYVYGGNYPYEGLDCSGFVNFVYRVFGLLPQGDRTAEGIYEYFNKNQDKRSFIHYAPSFRHSLYMPGDLVFYGKSRITHITLFFGPYNQEVSVIGASGGNKLCTNFDEARARDAKVKITPLHSRKDIVCIIGPVMGDARPE